jgi:tail tape-measure protein
MAEKRVSVRLAAVGGKQVKAEFEGIGDAGKRGFGKASREMEIANARLARFARRAKIAAGIMAAAAVAAGIAMVRSGLKTIDEQAKLAASLNTTTASMQVLARAADLAGVSQGEVSQATIMMTKSLSQAAAGTGPAVKALQLLNLSAADLAKLPIDEKMSAIQDAIAKFIPSAQQAAVASQIFGSRAGLIFTRIDSATLRQATQDVQDFGVAVSETDAAQIQRTNDALSRMGLLWRGISNQLAVAAAPALEAIANAMAAIGKTTGPLGRAIKVLFNHLGEIATIAATFAAVLGGRLVISLARAALGIKGVSLSLAVLRGALIRTGIGALIVGAGTGSAARSAAEVAKTVWKLATDSLKDYATKATDVGKGIGNALVGAFTSAENAIGQFVKTGKLDFKSLVTSLLADMAKLSARKFILGPLSNVLSGALGNLGGIFAPVLHAGGLVGSAAPQRMVPAMAFANAPRMHSGGWAGLRPDEVPAILQKGERVLNRREASQYGIANAQNITINIQTRDAESFRQSRTQVSADIARAVAMGRRGV